MRKQAIFVVLAALLLALTTAPTFGSIVFDFSFAGTGISGSGTLNAVDNGGGIFTATSGSATVTSTVMGLANFNLVPNPNAPSYTTMAWDGGNFDYDNILNTTASPILDGHGLMFTQTLGGQWAVNISYDTAYHAWQVRNSPAYASNTPVTFSLTQEAPVPEPATIIIWSLLGLTSGGLWVVRRRNAVGGAGRKPWADENRTAILEIIGR